jgi:nucleoside-diphosphate-sugar epimerase
LQLIDVRDAARFVVGCLERGVAGPVNVGGVTGSVTFGSLLAGCRRATGSAARLVWADDQFLSSHGVREWTELPLWRPAPGTWAADVTRARSLGLDYRPLAVTVRDTWAWLRSGGQVAAHWRTAEHGIALEKERRLISEWRARQRGRPESTGM